MDEFYDNNNFDIRAFNREFNERKRINEENELKMEQQLNDKINEENEEENDDSTGLNPILNLLSNCQSSMYGLTYDLVTVNYSTTQEFYDVWTKDNRLYYLGIFLLIISFFMFLVSYIFSHPEDKSKDINVNIPQDYSFKYMPYEEQKADNVKKILELENQVRGLINQNRGMQSRINSQGRFFADQSRQMNQLSQQVQSNNMASPAPIIIQQPATPAPQDSINVPQLNSNNFGQPLAGIPAPGAQPLPPPGMGPPGMGPPGSLTGGEFNKMNVNELNSYVTFSDEST